MNTRVLCAGRVYGDLVFSGLPRLPAPGEEVFADALSLHVGGGAWITAAWLAALGRESALCTVLPREPFGTLVRAAARDGGVDLASVTVATDGDPQLTVVHVVDGDRAFTTRRTGAALPPEAVRTLGRAGLRHLHIGELTTHLEHPELAHAAREAGISVSLDCGWDDAALVRGDLPARLVDVDVFLPNEAEADAIGPRALEALPVPLVVVKRGADGASARAASGSCHRAARAVEPVDTTGAGDAFDAGFLHAWLEGRPLDRCLALGNACGALAVTRRGGADGLPSLATLAEDGEPELVDAVPAPAD